MRWLLCLFLMLLAASVSFADGIVLPRAVDPASVKIPDQEALISYVDGVETLAIETRFKGEGSEFAWIVPTPSVPEVSAGTLGTFPSLRAIFAPSLEEIGGVAGAIIVLAGILLLVVIDVLFWRRPAKLVQWLALVAAILLGVGVFMPSLGKSRGVGSGPAELSVQVHERMIVGAYDVAVLSSGDGGALMRWLGENGFAAPAGIQAVVDQYVKDGWCFVASRLRRDDSGAALMTPHPLVLRFTAKAPVYPMRLTAHGMEDSLGLDLYVFGSGTASAPGMKVVTSGDVHRESKSGWGSWSDEGLDVSHSAIAGLTAGAVHATRLSGSFKPAQMAQDLVLSIGTPSTERPFVVSHRDAVLGAVAALLGSSCLAGIVIFLRYRAVIERGRRARVLGVIAGAGLVVGAAVFLWMPRVDTVSGRRAYFGSSFVRNAALMLVYGDKDKGIAEAATLAEARERLRQGLSGALAEFGDDGGIEEGDGPGNYRLEEEDGWVVLRYVDLHGREQEEQMLVRVADDAGASKR